MVALLVLLAACATPTDTAKVDAGESDLDGDGTLDVDDCADGNPDIHPGVTDLCNGVDDDCDGLVDEDAGTATWYRDQDGDGFGDPAQTVTDCEQPAGYVADASDCEPARADAYPGADEHCDGVDHDCDGELMDADAVDGYPFYPDADGDGFGDGSSYILACVDPGGYVGNPDDCDDTRADVNPAAPEVCDDADADEDCDGLVDEFDTWWTGGTPYYVDADGDGHGDLDATPVWACSQPDGYSADYTDCDDTDPEVSPSAPEVCDGEDDDCDGEIDEADAVGAVIWYTDGDGDGHGDASTATLACDAPPDGVTVGDDCDDDNDTIFPGAAEDCDSTTDANCDGYAGPDDHDGDGYAACEECDDGDATIFPGGDERCDGVDDDCDGAVDEADAIDPATWYVDVDGDGFGDASVSTSACDAPAGYVDDATDCDDADADTFPGAPEACTDATDRDCDGLVSFVDADGDGAAACVDCDDTDPTAFPGAPEIAADGVDQDCDGADVGADTLAAATTAWLGDAAGDALGAGALVAAVDADGIAPLDFLVTSPTSQNGGYANGSAWLNAADPAGGGSVSADALAVVAGRGATGLVGGAAAYTDQDGDGVADLFVGAPTGGVSGTGEAQLLLGPLTGVLDVEVDSSARLVCTTSCGRTVALADVDGDGLGELWTGATDSVFAVRGTAAGSVHDFDAAWTFSGAGLGGSLLVEDLDGDGIVDVVAGSPDGDGAVYAWTAPTAGAYTLADADGTVPGTPTHPGFGALLTRAGDLDGDGLVDVWAAGSDRVTGLAGALGTVWATVDVAANSFAGDGDLDADGAPDLVVGEAADAGLVRVWSGPTGALTRADAAGTWTGLAAGDAAGTTVAIAGDVDGDGRDDWLVGAPGAAATAGTLYLLGGTLLP